MEWRVIRIGKANFEVEELRQGFFNNRWIRPAARRGISSAFLYVRPSPPFKSFRDAYVWGCDRYGAYNYVEPKVSEHLTSSGKRW